MAKAVVFLAQNRFSPPIEVQRAACVVEGDLVIEAGTTQFAGLVRSIVHHKKHLLSGDRLKLYDLNSLAMAPAQLIRLLSRLLRAEITLELCADRLTITPDPADPAFRFLCLLQGHQRTVHSLRTHTPEMKAGRRAAISDSEWPTISGLLEARTPQQAIAARYGVGRTTLFNFVKRMRGREGSVEE